MIAQVKIKEAVCDICGRVYKETRKRYYCEHCNRHYYVCTTCKDKIPHCPSCGLILMKKSAPALPDNYLIKY